MPVLTIQGSWYGSGCAEFNGVYADLGTVSHTNYSLVQTGAGACTGFNFIVVDNTDGSTFYTSTSPGKDLALFFDGSPPSEKYDCINGICTPASTYGSPGVYPSKSACELVCGVNPDGRVCLTPQEYATVQNLINQIKSKSCD